MGLVSGSGEASASNCIVSGPPPLIPQLCEGGRWVRRVQGVRLDAARLRLEVIAKTHSGNGPISLQHRREGKDKEPYEYLNCNFPRFLQLTFFFFCGGGEVERREEPFRT